MKKARSFLMAGLACAIVCMSLFVVCGSGMSAESDDMTKQLDQIVQRLVAVEGNQTALLERINSLEETVIREIKARCTR
ncbi:hypothetical protein ACFL1E_07080 [Candidatus Omnitrophota bacterium]